MHVIVLAAGRGSRLGRFGDEKPKWLLDVAGRTIADRQLEGISDAGDAVASVRVVVGHAAEAIDAFLAGRDEAVALVPNPEWSTRNNWWSLLRALRELPDDGPIAVLNSDLLVQPGQVTAFLRDAAAGGDEGVLAIDFARDLTDESMKVTQADGGELDRIGKRGVEPAVGEYIGMLAARGGVLRHLREVLETFVEREEAADEWYEGAVGVTAAAGRRWALWPVTDGDWVEIDDDADLDAAQALAGAA